MAESTLRTVSQALIKSLEAITGLKAYAHPTTSMPSPCVVVLLSQPLDDAWDDPTGGPIEARLLVIARWGANGLDGARVLDDYCGFDGDKSIYQALRSSHTASGALNAAAVQSIRFREVQEPRTYTMPDNSQWWGRAIRAVIHPKTTPE